MKCLIETLTIQGRKRTNKKSLLISFSGIGDPLLNIELIEQVYNLESILKNYKMAKRDRIKLLNINLLKTFYYYPNTLVYKLFGIIPIAKVKENL